jgi:Putative amidoligase enzyme
MGRYRSLNLESVGARGTIEFRLFQATTSFQAVRANVELALAFVARVPDRYPPGAKGRPTAEGALMFRLPDRVLYGDSHQSLVDQLLNAGTFEHSISGKAAAPLPTAGREAFSAHVIRQLETLGAGSLEHGDAHRTRAGRTRHAMGNRVHTANGALEAAV